MLSRACICLGVAVLVMIHISCAKLSEEQPVTMGTVATEELPDKDSIPAEWGKLVAVSSAPDIDNWVQLWLEDEGGTIRMVAYHIIQNKVSSQARVFPRK